ncbi:hypothetical protein [Paenibacillus xylanilyticus]|uniref:hypothetical protein n=1 Tax=Paenibacillus xylanilyticus TaxID=248903 RepID=UPI0039A33A1C
MSRFGKRMVTVIVFMLLGVLLGMQLAGGDFQIDDVPEVSPAVVKTEPAAESEPAVSVQQEEKETPIVPVQTPSQVLGAEQNKAPVDVLADKTAGLLQNLSHNGIKWVVSLFSGVAE